MRSRSVLLAFAAAMLVAPLSQAAGVDPANATAVQREQAQARFLKGKARFDKNDFSGALEDFRASVDIVASPNTRLYIARTLREMGRLVEAYAEYGRTAAEAKEHEREDGRYGKAAEAALAERAAIAPQIGFVELKVVNAGDATTVNVGGSQLVRGGWNEPVPIKPGEVEVELITPGVLPVRKSVSVHAGQKSVVTIDANVGSIASGGDTTTATPVDHTPPSTTSHEGKGWMLPAAIVGGGVGVVGMLIFAGAGAASASTYSDLKAKCGLATCPAQYQGEVSSGRTQQAVANTGLVFGLIGLAAGATFFTLWVLPSKKAPMAASVSVGLGSVSLSGSF